MAAGKGHDKAGRGSHSGARARSRAVTLITSAQKSPLQDWKDRRKLYITLQLSRLLLMAMAGLLMWWTNNLWISASVAMISLPLPWIAVLLANETGNSDPRSQRVYQPQLVREARKAQALEAERQRQLSQGENAPTDQPQAVARKASPDIIDIE